jgi:hypothetical protein
MKSPLLAGGLALAGFAVLLAADAKVDYSHHTDFEQYHTYAWGARGSRGPALGRQAQERHRRRTDERKCIHRAHRSR